MPEFKEASLKLEVDEVSDLVSTMHGYHIIKAYEKIEKAIFDFGEKKDEIKEMLDGKLKSEFVNEEIKKWVEEADVVRYKDRI